LVYRRPLRILPPATSLSPYAIVSLAAGIVARSVALVGFGVDSGIEVTASVAALWRLRADFDPVRRELVERVTHRAIGASFLRCPP
jgi:hypothetical protein